ncbi:hypothetical protein [Rugamonas sp.]|uniref:hypothetical protein n=1 Tax=Rugamonas sp. TaxID=1926287 RepID=UPI0026002950|nr:hypothetical protein [Rugamonas sp.]
MAADIKVAKIIDALPDYYVLSAGDDDGALVLTGQEPILAWALDREFYIPYPITQGGMQVDAPVLRPDQTVAIGGAAYWLSVAEWLADKQEELAIQRKQKRWDVVRKEQGITEKAGQEDKPAAMVSSAKALIHGVLEAARTGKVRP